MREADGKKGIPGDGTEFGPLQDGTGYDEGRGGTAREGVAMGLGAGEGDTRGSKERPTGRNWMRDGA